MAQYVLGVAPPPGSDPGPETTALVYTVIDRLLTITGGQPNDRPPPSIGAPLGERPVKRPQDIARDVASDVAAKVGTELAFGYQPLGSGDEIPLVDRVTAEELAFAARTLPEPHVLPMWAADP